MRIVFPEGSGCVQKPEDLLHVKTLGTVEYYETPPQSKADLIARLQDADVVFLDYSVMDAEVIAACPKLKFVCFFGVGYSNCIDVAAATTHGVTVSYTPGYGAASVAEFTLGLMLSLTRHIAASYYSLKHGEWLSAKFQGVDLKGKTLGIVGLGPIGADLARLGAGIGMRLLGWTRHPAPGRAPEEGAHDDVAAELVSDVALVTEKAEIQDRDPASRAAEARSVECRNPHGVDPLAHDLPARDRARGAEHVGNSWKIRDAAQVRPWNDHLREIVRLSLPDAARRRRLDHRTEGQEVDPFLPLDQDTRASRGGLLLIPREDGGYG